MPARLWRSTLRPHAVRMRQAPDQICPYHQIDGFSLHTLMPDLVHVCHLGIGQDLGASCLCWLLASGYLAPQQSPEQHLADLGLEIKAWCCAKGLRPPPRHPCGHAPLARLAPALAYRGLSTARAAAWLPQMARARKRFSQFAHRAVTQVLLPPDDAECLPR